MDLTEMKYEFLACFHHENPFFVKIWYFFTPPPPSVYNMNGRLLVKWKANTFVF
jgi:hypothetical protein